MLMRKLLFVLSVLVCLVAVPALLRFWRQKERTVAPPPLWIRAMLISVAVVFLSILTGASQIDDSYIYDRYIANALAGHGLVYNLGEHVNGLSSPVFGYLLLFGGWVARGRVLLASELLSALGMLLASLLAESLVPWAGLLVATSAFFYALTGMETTAFAVMLLLAVKLYLKGQYRWLPLVCVLLALTRFEGAVLVLVLLVASWRQRQRPKAIYFLPALALLTAYLLLNKKYYGMYVPSSAVAKLGQGFSGYWGPWPTAFLQPGVGWLHTLFEGVIYLAPALIGLAVVGVLNWRKQRLIQVTFPFCVVLLLVYVGMNMSGDYFWYMGPLVLFALIYAASAVPSTRWGTVAVVLFLCLNVVQTARLLNAYKPKPYYYDYVEAGRWFQSNTPKDATVGAVEIGLLGWSSQRYIYDAIGLTTPRNAAYVSQHDSDMWLVEDRPDYVFVHASPWYWEVVAQNSPEYTTAVRLSNGDVILRRKDYFAPTAASR